MMVCEYKSHSEELSLMSLELSETGGWGDHVTPFHSPSGTPGEWLNVENDVFGYLGQTYTGPGKLNSLFSNYIRADWARFSSSVLYYFPLDPRRSCLH
jgi:hypothetical protein